MGIKYRGTFPRISARSLGVRDLMVSALSGDTLDCEGCSHTDCPGGCSNNNSGCTANTESRNCAPFHADEYVRTLNRVRSRVATPRRLNFRDLMVQRLP